MKEFFSKLNSNKFQRTSLFSVSQPWVGLMSFVFKSFDEQLKCSLWTKTLILYLNSAFSVTSTEPAYRAEAGTRSPCAASPAAVASPNRLQLTSWTEGKRKTSAKSRGRQQSTKAKLWFAVAQSSAKGRNCKTVYVVDLHASFQTRHICGALLFPRTTVELDWKCRSRGCFAVHGSRWKILPKLGGDRGVHAADL